MLQQIRATPKVINEKKIKGIRKKATVAHFEVEGLRKTTKHLTLDSRSANRDLDPDPPEQEAGLLTIQLQCLIFGISLGFINRSYVIYSAVVFILYLPQVLYPIHIYTRLIQRFTP
jgi:hypothetical protein